MFTFSPRAVALSRYGARAMTRYVRNSPRLMRSGRIIQRGMRPVTVAAGGYEVGKLTTNPRFKKQLASVINKRKKMITKRKIGNRIGQSNAKQNAIQQALTVATKSLQSEALLNLPKIAAGATTMNTRERRTDVVNWRGIKFCLNFRNLGGPTSTPYPSVPLHIHVAVISRKASNILATTDFFRAAGDDNSRAVNFTNALSGMDLRCLPINTDEFDILKHKRIILAPYDVDDGRQHRYMEFWLPFRRQIRYETSSDSPEGRNLWLVHWASFPDEIAGALGVNNAYTVDYRIVKYFRDPVGM